MKEHIDNLIEIRSIAPFSENERRKITRITFDEFQPHYVEIINNIPQGAQLGNHYHKTKQELMYISKGEFYAQFEHVKTHRNLECSLQEGQIFLIPCYIAHKYISQAEENEIIAFSSHPQEEIKNDVFEWNF